jgi:hypothetical protein
VFCFSQTFRRRSLSPSQVAPFLWTVSDDEAGRFEVDEFIMDWKPIDTAPFDRDLELSVINGDGAAV